MKLLALLLSLLLSTQLFAANDSVGIFHRPEKVAILVNERGEGARLQMLMDNLNAGKDLHVINEADSIMLTCGRIIDAASCTFSFLKGKGVLIETNPRQLFATADLKELGIESSEKFETIFESSMGDYLHILVADGKIHFTASKKVLGRSPAIAK